MWYAKTKWIFKMCNNCSAYTLHLYEDIENRYTQKKCWCILTQHWVRFGQIQL